MTCCRSSQGPVRYRTASDTNEAARNGTATAASPLSVPISPGAHVGSFRTGVNRLAAAHLEAGQVFLANLADHAGKVERAILPQAVALWLFAVLAGLGALLAIGQILSRRVFLHSAESPVLKALGMDRGQLLSVQFLRVGLIAVAGAVLGVAIAVATSALMPIGPARLGLLKNQRGVQDVKLVARAIDDGARTKLSGAQGLDAVRGVRPQTPGDDLEAFCVDKDALLVGDGGGRGLRPGRRR